MVKLVIVDGNVSRESHTETLEEMADKIAAILAEEKVKEPSTKKAGK